MVGTHEAYEEMIQVAEDFAASGDANAMIRLGRAYRDGKGVDLDLDKAEALFKQASEKSPSAKRELKTIVRP
jgi:TPR repeat protein